MCGCCAAARYTGTAHAYIQPVAPRGRVVHAMHMRCCTSLLSICRGDCMRCTAGEPCRVCVHDPHQEAESHSVIEALQRGAVPNSSQLRVCTAATQGPHSAHMLSTRTCGTAVAVLGFCALLTAKASGASAAATAAMASRQRQAAAALQPLVATCYTTATSVIRCLLDGGPI